MALDWNLYNQIAQKSNYQQKVDRKQREAGYLDELERRTEKKQAEQMQYSEAMSGYLEQIDQTIGQYLPQDVERVKGLEQNLKKSVLAKVKASGGDMKKFFLTGGSNVLREYKSQLVNSKEVTRAVQNKDTFMKINEDLKAGRFLRNVDMKAKLKDGTDDTVNMSPQEMIQAFAEGKLDSLTYNGSEEDHKVNPSMFLKQGSPRSRHTPTKVTVDELAAAYKAAGHSWEVAQRRADAQNTGDGSTSLWWGVDDYDWRGMAAMQKARNAGSGKSSKSSKKINDVFRPAIEGQIMNLQNIERATWTSADKRFRDEMMIGSKNLSSDIMSEILTAMGLEENLSTVSYSTKEGDARVTTSGKQSRWSGSFSNGDFLNFNTGQFVNLNPSDYEIEKVHGGIKVVRNRDGSFAEAYIMTDVKIPEGLAEDKGIDKWHGIGKDWKASGLSSHSNDARPIDESWTMNDSYSITVGQRIDLDPQSIDMINQNIGLQSENVVGGVQQQDYSAQAQLAPDDGIIFGNDPFFDQLQSTQKVDMKTLGLAREFEASGQLNGMNIAEIYQRFMQETYRNGGR